MSVYEGQVHIAGVRFDNIRMSDAVERVLRIVHKADAPQHVCTGNMDHLAMLAKDAEFKAIYDSAALVLADGMPIVWLSRLHPDTAPLAERVAGSDLLLELCRASAWTGLRLYFLGGIPGAADSAAEVLRERFPGVQIVGTHCPPHASFDSEAVQAEIAEKIRAAAPDVLLVGLGAPKQEKWIARHKMQLGVPVSIGVGGSFEMAAGLVSRAPRWIQKSGMEWAWRLAQDPKRLWARYIGRDLPFLLSLVGDAVVARLKSKQKPPISQPSTVASSYNNLRTAPLRATELEEKPLVKSN